MLLFRNAFLKIKTTVGENYLLIFLAAYGVFLIFFRSSGSLVGDEAIYAQVAREANTRDSWLTLYWRGEPWFEKPPLFIWFIMLSFRFLGMSEFSLHLVSGIFGVGTILLTYFLAREMFKDKATGFLAGYILATTPMFIWAIRSGLTDATLTFFITLGFYSIWKAREGDTRWLWVLGLAAGLSTMTKNIIGLLPLTLLPAYAIFDKKQRYLFRDRNMIACFSILILVLAPWHLAMTFLHGVSFWREYLLFHVISRFEFRIIASPWDQMPLAYLHILLERCGIWMVALLPLTLILRRKIIKRPAELFFLIIPFVTTITLLSLSSTKVPHYILPVIPLTCCLVGWLICESVRTGIRNNMFVVAMIYLNMTPSFVLRASDFGESNIAAFSMMRYLFRPSTSEYFLLIFTPLILLSSLALILTNTKKQVTFVTALLIIVATFSIPFNPRRNDFIKEMGENITKISNNEPLNLLFVDTPYEFYSDSNTSLFYLPEGSNAERIGKADLLAVEDPSGSTALCVVRSGQYKKEWQERIILSFKEGAVFSCSSKVGKRSKSYYKSDL